jgi:hypothetical protein
LPESVADILKQILHGVSLFLASAGYGAMRSCDPAQGSARLLPAVPTPKSLNPLKMTNRK